VREETQELRYCTRSRRAIAEERLWHQSCT